MFIQNLEDNTEIELIDPFEGKYADNTYISWSPSGEFLAVERISWADAMFEPPDTGLAIYTRDGEIYRLFDEVPFVDWSPNNGNQFLSTKERDLGEILPCIYDISSGEIDCLDEVSEWQTEKGVSVTSFKWHPVENKLSFIYWDYGPDRGGMCFIDLETSKINCPIDPSENGDRPFVVSYDWSPSGEYAYIFIDYYGPYGDDRFDMQLATIAKDGSDFRIWDLGRSSPKWKPLLEN